MSAKLSQHSVAVSEVKTIQQNEVKPPIVDASEIALRCIHDVDDTCNDVGLRKSSKAIRQTAEIAKVSLSIYKTKRLEEYSIHFFFVGNGRLEGHSTFNCCGFCCSSFCTDISHLSQCRKSESRCLAHLREGKDMGLHGWVGDKTKLLLSKLTSTKIFWCYS